MSRKRSRGGGPDADRRRALALLAGSRDGCTEAMMLSHGFTVEQTAELIRAGLVTAMAERIVMGRRTIEVARVRITARRGSGSWRHETSKNRKPRPRTTYATGVRTSNRGAARLPPTRPRVLEGSLPASCKLCRKIGLFSQELLPRGRDREAPGKSTRGVFALAPAHDPVSGTRR